jgi:hypothetical protein
VIGPGTFDDTGTANGVTLTDNGATIDIAGATDSATITDNAGNIDIGGTANSTTITNNNGSVDIIGAATSASFDLNGGDLTIGGAANSSTFEYGTGVSTVDLGGAIGSAAFENLNVGDGVVLSNFTFDGGSYDAITNMLTLTEGTTDVATLSLTLAPGVPTNFNFGGVDSFSVAPCYAAGTHIRTPRGEVAVEGLRVGDAVVTHLGEIMPIVWLGHRRVDCRRHPRPDLVWPVRVEAGAFSDGVPARDLWLSPDHAVFAEGVLIPIKYLLNATSVVQERVDSMHYFHVELDRHDILLAEGLPAESYLDTGNRGQFVNGGPHMTLHPDFAPLSWDDACAPLCTEGRPIMAVRRRLHDRMLDADGLRVLAAGRSVRAASLKGQLYRFLLPAGTSEIEINSIAAEVRYMGRRCLLGVCIGGIVADGKLVPIDGPGLLSGFLPIERRGSECWRWTDGAARLKLPHVSRRPVILELLVRDTMRSWVAPKQEAARLIA